MIPIDARQLLGIAKATTGVCRSAVSWHTAPRVPSGLYLQALVVCVVAAALVSCATLGPGAIEPRLNDRDHAQVCVQYVVVDSSSAGKYVEALAGIEVVPIIDYSVVDAVDAPVYALGSMEDAMDFASRAFMTKDAIGVDAFVRIVASADGSLGRRIDAEVGLGRSINWDSFNSALRAIEPLGYRLPTRDEFAIVLGRTGPPLREEISRRSGMPFDHSPGSDDMGGARGGATVVLGSGVVNRRLYVWDERGCGHEVWLVVQTVKQR